MFNSEDVIKDVIKLHNNEKGGFWSRHEKGGFWTAPWKMGIYT